MLGIREESTGWIRALEWLPTLEATEMFGVFQGHEIRVAVRGFFRARLWIDGKLCDQRSRLACLDRRVPFLTGRVLSAGPDVNLVHVYRRGPWTQIEVRVAGKPLPMNPATAR